MFHTSVALLIRNTLLTYLPQTQIRNITVDNHLHYVYFMPWLVVVIGVITTINSQHTTSHEAKDK